MCRSGCLRGHRFRHCGLPNKIKGLRLPPSITRPRSEARPPAKLRPAPLPNSIQIQQPAAVTPIKCGVRCGAGTIRPSKPVYIQRLEVECGILSLRHYLLCISVGYTELSCLVSCPIHYGNYLSVSNANKMFKYQHATR